jgi:hypothetical protein
MTGTSSEKNLWRYLRGKWEGKVPVWHDSAWLHHASLTSPLPQWHPSNMLQPCLLRLRHAAHGHFNCCPSKPSMTLITVSPSASTLRSATTLGSSPPPTSTTDGQRCLAAMSPYPPATMPPYRHTPPLSLPITSSVILLDYRTNTCLIISSLSEPHCRIQLGQATSTTNRTLEFSKWEPAMAGGMDREPVQSGRQPKALWGEDDAGDTSRCSDEDSTSAP